MTNEKINNIKRYEQENFCSEKAFASLFNPLIFSLLHSFTNGVKHYFKATDMRNHIPLEIVYCLTLNSNFMKKLSLFFLAFLMLFSANVFAQQSYNLSIAGVQVTDYNKNNITGTDISGSVSYDPANKVLTLNNASINLTGLYVDGIDSRIDNLIINLIGANSITAINSGIYSQANSTITGTGSLITNNAYYGIYLDGCNLTIENTTVTAIGSDSGISGYFGNSEVLTIKNSTVKATGTSYGSIAYINNMVLNLCAITQPAGAIFDASQKGVCVNGNIVTTEVVIEPVQPTYYDLYVAGVQVSDENRNDITSALVAAGKDASGTITYDPASNTITLDNASINQSSIYNAIPNLTINLTGENTITTESDGIKSEGVDFRITGSGSLTINAGVIGIYHYECNLTIENTSVTAIGTNFGIRGYNGNNEVLTITNSTVRAKGTNQGSIVKINNLVLNACQIVQPVGAIFDAGQRAVCVNGTLVQTEVMIVPATPTTYTVSGTVLDNENNPLANVEIAYNGGSTTTAADGTYSFTSTANTTYTVTPSKTGYTFTPATKTVNVAQADVTGQDFVGTAVTTYTVSGTVTYGTNPIAGVTITYNSGTTTTLTDGTYSFVATENTTYTVTPSLSGYTFAPASLTVNVVDADVTGQDFVGTAEVAQTVLFYENFDNSNEIPSGWTTVDADGDGFCWQMGSSTDSNGLNGSDCICSESFINNYGMLYPDNWLISPAINLLSDATLKYYAAAQDADWSAEHYGVYISTTGTNTTDFTLLFEETMDVNGGSAGPNGAKGYGIYKQKTIDLSAYAGETVYIAFRHFNCSDEFRLKIDEIEITATPTTYTVSGTVLDNENNPLANVEIAYNDGTTTTAADGTYSFTSAANTTYTVTASKLGYSFAPASLTVNVAEADVTGVDFVGTANAVAPTTYTVSGTVTDGTNPLAGVTITYNSGTTTTLTDGTYSFVATENTNYTVTPSKTGYTFTPATKTVNVAQADVTGQDFVGTAVATYTVSGTVKAIADDSPIEGVTITYNGGGMNGTTTTAADGTYSFVANENTTYTVIANKTGFSFAPAIKTVNVAEANLTGIDFYGIVTYIVEGIVRDVQNDNPIAGVTISYTGGSTTTASDGIFSFTAEANTSYTVTPSKAGYTFTPATKTVNVAEANVTGIIFYGTADGTPVDETEINAITVYPNPANDYIKVAGLTGNEEILVFDINGRIVKTLQANDNIETISINNLAKGSYMIKVRKENKIEILKFIK